MATESSNSEESIFRRINIESLTLTSTKSKLAHISSPLRFTFWGSQIRSSLTSTVDEHLPDFKSEKNTMELAIKRWVIRDEYERDWKKKDLEITIIQKWEIRSIYTRIRRLNNEIEYLVVAVQINESKGMETQWFQLQKQNVSPSSPSQMMEVKRRTRQNRD